MKNFFFWGMGLIVLFFVVYIGLVHPNNAVINHHIFFIKYAAFVFMTNVSILMFCLPYLYKKEIVSSDYHNENRFVKAKADFAVMTILLPGIMSIFSAIFLAIDIKTPIKWVMFIAFLYTYIKSIYLLWFKR